jgi:TFIIF-interacting CTD phosphatase-like protein
MHEMYVIVVYENSVAIYNAATGHFLEEKGKLDKFKYKTACVNYNGNEIYLVTHNN